MSNKESKIKVEIFGTSYILRGESDTEYMQKLASYVDRKMREIQDGTGIISTAKIAILAALNITDELCKANPEKKEAIKESIEVDEKDIEEKILEIAENSGQKVETVRNHYKEDEARERLRDGLKTEKTLDFIIKKAKIKEVERRKNDTNSDSD